MKMHSMKEYYSQGSSNFIKHSRKMRQSWPKMLYGISLALVLMICISYVLEENKNLKMEMKQLQLSLEKGLKESLKKEDLDGIQSQLNSKVQLRRLKRSPNESRASIATNGYNFSILSGAAYFRWGRRDCPGPDSQLVYHGIAAGSWYTHTGGPSNILCLHMNISYEIGKYRNGNQGSSYIYGLEFRDSSWINSIMNMSLTESNTIQYHSVPCALCFARSKGTQVMIAGQSRCPHGWTKEYTGFIMSGAHGDKHSSEAICVDDTPQVVPGTSGSNNGAYLMVVETQCTSLLCEPFVAGREVRCVVCTI